MRIIDHERRAEWPDIAARRIASDRQERHAIPSLLCIELRHPSITKQQMTKNTSAPANPQPAGTNRRWNNTTAITAAARRPSMSGR